MKRRFATKAGWFRRLLSAIGPHLGSAMFGSRVMPETTAESVKVSPGTTLRSVVVKSRSVAEGMAVRPRSVVDTKIAPRTLLEGAGVHEIGG